MDGLIGIIANLCSITLVQPIDIIKTRYQVSLTSTSIREIYRNIYISRGWKGFYQGLSPNLMTYPIFWGVYFQTKKELSDLYIQTHELPASFAISLMASMTASCISNPLYVLKTRMQTYKMPRYSLVVREIYKDHGYKGMSKGLPATMLNDSKMAIQFPLYDLMQKKFDCAPISLILSKLISSSIFYPFDLIRVNQRNSSINLTIKNSLMQIYKTSGIRGFYRGLFLYTCVSTPNFVIMMLIKETIEKYYYQ